MDFLDQYGIQLFGDSSDDDETYLVSNPRKIKATAMRKYIIYVTIIIPSVAINQMQQHKMSSKESGNLTF